MKIVFYTSGTTGIGRLVFGISIYNALIRKKIKPDFTIISSCPSSRTKILNSIAISHIELPVGKIGDLLGNKFESSHICKTLKGLKPDILIVDRMWMTLYRIIEELNCKKIFICSQVNKNLFFLKLPDKTFDFQTVQYDRTIAIEPFKSSIKMEQVNPLIIRNKDEILPKETALNKLGLTGNKKICFIGMNFKSGYFEQLKQKYSYIEDEGEYDVIYSTNIYGKGIFPIADYYNAIDLLICPATYNHFWESRYFNKKAIFEKVPVNFCDLDLRIKEFSNYQFEENGADQLADIILNL